MHTIDLIRKTSKRARAGGTRPLRTPAAGANLCLVMALGLCFPAVARAGIVSGRVYVEGKLVNAPTTLSAVAAAGQPVTFKTDASGNFSVYLDPGSYTVNLSSDSTEKGTIDSYPQPVQQDIHLTPQPR
jgi:hypothetical protein